MSDYQYSCQYDKLSEFKNQLDAFAIKSVIFGSTTDPDTEEKASKEMEVYRNILMSLYAEALKGSNV